MAALIIGLYTMHPGWADESATSQSALVVKGTDGQVLIPRATFKGVTEGRLIFQTGGLFRSLTPAEIDPALLAQLGLSVGALEEEAAEARKRKARWNVAHAQTLRQLETMRAERTRKLAEQKNRKSAEAAEAQRKAEADRAQETEARIRWIEAQTALAWAQAAASPAGSIHMLHQQPGQTVYLPSPIQARMATRPVAIPRMGGGCGGSRSCGPQIRLVGPGAGFVTGRR